MHKTPEITRLIRENVWIVLSFALAKPEAQRIVETHFLGEWKYLDQLIHEVAEIRADRALLEMATQLRILDDTEGLDDKLKAYGFLTFGTLTKAKGNITDLHFRDMTNKVIHAAKFEWHFGRDPSVECKPDNSSRWQTAEIKLISLMGLVGLLIP